MIREGGSASRVSTRARPGTQEGGQYRLIPDDGQYLMTFWCLLNSPERNLRWSPLQTGQASADDTHNQECSHDVVGLYAHKGTMWNTDDRVPQKDIKSPYGGGVSTLPGAAGGSPPGMFPVVSALPIDDPQLDAWQVAVVWVDETLQGILQNKSLLVIHRTGVGRWIRITHRLALCILLYKGALLVLDHADSVGQHAVIPKKLLGPAGPKVKEPLALLVLNHADQRAAIQNTTSLWERLPAQPELPCGDGLVEPTVRQVSGSALDSQLMEGITYSEVSLDSRPMEGSSGLKPVEQSILQSPRIMRPHDGSRLVEMIPDEELTVCQVLGMALDSQLMEGISQPELRALEAPSDSRPMEECRVKNQ